ncbi:hypothetical protein EGW08_005255 [Elysia chlorotica]|uniref:DUF1279 domain-containing protein n=1 Tax=Elysia chlorotica TaxID=188477 RepID=A0A3S1BRL6_ELYCH|nr:hypothetical protein EGW08_005255 [Elysia chlorotica]
MTMPFLTKQLFRLRGSSACMRYGGSFCMSLKDSSIRYTVRPISNSKPGFTQEIEDEVSPQGIQGDDCVNFKLWKESCARYGFTNCNEQLQGIQSGRKTLAEVLAEQDQMIADIAKEYRAANQRSDRQGVQDNYTDFPNINAPCPQGIQGDDCARFKLWLENCHRFGVGDCIHEYSSFRAGRKTLAQMFEEQDRMIREAVKMVAPQKRNYSTSSGDRRPSQNPEGDGKVEGSEGDAPPVQLTQRQKLQRAVKAYGGTVIVFHVTISLASLGFFYLLVSSGLDVAGFLLRLDIGGEVLKSKLAAGTGTFVLAYAVHKVFAPVRIATTLTATPFIVRYLRKVGFLKAPSGPKPKV